MATNVTEHSGGYLECDSATCGPLVPFAKSAVTLSLGRKVKRADDLGSFLESCKSLEYLSLHSPTLLSDPPKKSAVKTLHISGSTLEDLSFLSGFSKLEELKLPFRGSKVADLSPISFTPKLKRLGARSTHITSIDELPTGLQELVVSACKKLRSVAGLSNCKKLLHVDLNQTAVDDISSLSSHKKLRAVKMRGTKVTSLEPLFSSRDLETLYAERSKLKSLDGVGENLGKLKLLWLHLTPIKDLSPLQGLNELLELDLSGVKATDFSPLAGLRNLKYLDLYETSFDDLDILDQLPDLATVRLGKTKVRQKDPRVAKLNKRMRAKHGKDAGLKFGKPTGGLSQLRETDAFCVGGDIEHHEMNLDD